MAEWSSEFMDLINNWERYSKWSPHDLYHGTALANLFSIAKNGLVPRLARWHQENRPEEAFPGIYMTPDSHLADSYGSKGGETPSMNRSRMIERVSANAILRGERVQSARANGEELSIHNLLQELHNLKEKGILKGDIFSVARGAITDDYPSNEPNRAKWRELREKIDSEVMKGKVSLTLRNNLGQAANDAAEAKRMYFGRMRQASSPRGIIPHAQLQVSPLAVKDLLADVSVNEVNRALEESDVSAWDKPENNIKKKILSLKDPRERAVATLTAAKTIPFRDSEVVLDKPLPARFIRAKLPEAEFYVRNKLLAKTHTLPEIADTVEKYSGKLMLAQEAEQKAHFLPQVLKMATKLKLPLVALGLAAGIGTLMANSDDSA